MHLSFCDELVIVVPDNLAHRYLLSKVLVLYFVVRPLSDILNREAFNFGSILAWLKADLHISIPDLLQVLVKLLLGVL